MKQGNLVNMFSKKKSTQKDHPLLDYSQTNLARQQQLLEKIQNSSNNANQSQNTSNTPTKSDPPINESQNDFLDYSEDNIAKQQRILARIQKQAQNSKTTPTKEETKSEPSKRKYQDVIDEDNELPLVNEQKPIIITEANSNDEKSHTFDIFKKQQKVNPKQVIEIEEPKKIFMDLTFDDSDEYSKTTNSTSIKPNEIPKFNKMPAKLLPPPSISSSQQQVSGSNSPSNLSIKKSQLRNISDPLFNAYWDAPFSDGEDVPFSMLAQCFDEVDKISGKESKDRMVDCISNLYRSIMYHKPEHLIYAFVFTVFRIQPEYESKNEIGVGQGTIVKALSKTTGRSEKQIYADTKKVGDLGKVAAFSKANQSSLKNFMKTSKEKRLTIKQVVETFKFCSELKGQNSNIERERQMVKLFQDSKETEPIYLVRFFEKNFHIGALETTMRVALAKSALIKGMYNEKELIDRKLRWKQYIPNYDKNLIKWDNILQRAIAEYPNYNVLIEGIHKIQGTQIEKLLETSHITTHIPLRTMLAQPTNGVQVIFKRFENTKFTCEYKYDGLRGQIHYDKGTFNLFSRRLENITEAYPDVIDVMERALPDEGIESFIIDSEIVAYNPQTQKVLPFQKLSTRSKKSVDINSIEVTVCIFAFDLIYLNGKSLLNTPFSERRDIMKKNFQEIENEYQYAKYMDAETFDAVEEFLIDSIKNGAEGLMVKDLKAPYEPGKRSWNWLKLKKDYLEGSDLGDTFDLVPIAAYHGSGKRTGTLGSYLLACYNSDTGEYETFCLTGRGFTDEKFKELNDFFLQNTLDHCPKEYNVKSMGADLWLKPLVVWEVKGSDIQISPLYTAGIGEVDANKGMGLRFPRIVKFRDDKNPTDATDSTTIARIYKQQAAVLNDTGFGDGDFDGDFDDDFIKE